MQCTFALWWITCSTNNLYCTGSIGTVETTGTPLSESEMTPLEIAHEGEHSSLYKALKPIFKLNVRDAILEKLEEQFHELIEGEMGWTEDSCRLPRLGVLREGTGTGWFPVRPGVDQEVSFALSCYLVSVQAGYCSKSS